MTGEMSEHDVTREAFPVHFAIADALGGTVEPFDQYQGPYISVPDARYVGREQRLWLGSEDGVFAYVYNETTDNQSETFPSGFDDTPERAVMCARSIL